METNMMQTMVMCNGVHTDVLTAGCDIHQDLAQTSYKEMVIVIPGNPGIPQFYKGFIRTLKSKLPTDIPVLVVGHAGHVQPQNNIDTNMPAYSTWNEHYSLMSQLQHKLDFIKTFVPKDVKIHLIGHSIGAWIILNMLKDEYISKRVVKCYLMFPVIEHIAITRNGSFFTQVVARIAFFLIFMCWILSWLPLHLQLCLLGTFAPLFGVPKKHVRAVLQLLNPHSLKNVIELAKEEMEIVKERDDDTLLKYAYKLWFYYGTCDGWAPVKYYKNLKSKYPHMDAELCKRNIHHSFVLKFEKEMGEIVADEINENITFETSVSNIH